MEPIQTAIFILLAAILGVLVYVFFLKREEKEPESQGMVLLQQQLQELTRTMDERIGETNRTMQEGSRMQFRESRELIQEINKEMNEQLRSVVKGVAEVSESSKQVFAVADQLKELQDILKNPKQRGVLGEYFLETVLQNVLPAESFEMQYALGESEEGKKLIPDAVVFVKGKVIPIDSKFSLENYNRMSEAKDAVEKEQYRKVFINDLKLRIQETAKYIRPEYKTMDFAFMFIPHEGIYYDLLANPAAFGSEENLIQRAAGTYRVIIVSPTSFLAYLQTVMQGLKALEIEEKALDIIKNVGRLQTHWSKYEDYYQKLGRTLETSVNHYNAGYKELGKIDKDVTKITGESIGIDILSLDKPQQSED
jgi:DNA recombination protein RmuC